MHFVTKKQWHVYIKLTEIFRKQSNGTKNCKRSYSVVFIVLLNKDHISVQILQRRAVNTKVEAKMNVLYNWLYNKQRFNSNFLRIKRWSCIFQAVESLSIRSFLVLWSLPTLAQTVRVHITLKYLAWDVYIFHKIVLCIALSLYFCLCRSTRCP
jgi:hypothetical protein